MKYTNEYGDVDEEFYDKIYEILEQFCALLKTPEGKPLYIRFRERLLGVRTNTTGIAWGLGDAVKILITKIEEFFEEEERDS